MNYPIKTKKQVRGSFWDYYGRENYIKGQKQNDYNTTIRVTFCGYVEHLRESEQISEKLAYNVTLSE